MLQFLTIVDVAHVHGLTHQKKFAESKRERKYTKNKLHVWSEIIWREKESKQNFSLIYLYAHGWRKDVNSLLPLPPISSPSERNVNLFSCWYKSRIKYDFSCFLYGKKQRRKKKCPRGIKYRKPFLFSLPSRNKSEVNESSFLLVEYFHIFSRETARDALFSHI